MSAAIGSGSNSSSSSNADSNKQQQLGAGEDTNVVSRLLKRGEEGSGDKEALLRQLELEEFDRRLQDRTGGPAQQQAERPDE